MSKVEQLVNEAGAYGFVGGTISDPIPFESEEELRVGKPIRGRWKWDEKLNALVPYVEPPRPIVHSVITDEMDPARHNVTRRWISSKKEYSRETARTGWTEVGNEEIKAYDGPPPPPPGYEEKLRDDAEKAYEGLKNNNMYLDEPTRERCKLIEHNLEHYNYDRRPRDFDGNLLD